MNMPANRGNTEPRPDYTFEQLEAAIDIAPTAPLQEIGPEFEHVGKMMLNRNSDYHIFVNNAGIFVKALVERESLPH